VLALFRRAPLQQELRLVYDPCAACDVAHGTPAATKSRVRCCFKSRFGQYLSLARSLVAVCARLEASPVVVDLANYSATETLRDGRTVEIRAQRSQDREGMHAANARSSSGSLYRRFFTVRREFSEKEAHYFLDIDFVKHVALVAFADEEGARP
jgi:hypothetical protein